MEQNYDVFISFSKKEMKLADKFFEKLNTAGKSVFFYVESQNPGDNYEQRINDALHSSKDFLLICTVNSAASRQVRKECEIFNLFYKNALGTGDEKRIFIFEGQNFEDAYVPDIEGWDKIHRCNNFDKQIAALGVQKKKNNFLRWMIIGLIILLATLIGIYLLQPKNQVVDCENKSVSFLQDTIIVEENKDSIVNLANNVIYLGFEEIAKVEWMKDDEVTSNKLARIGLNSGTYIVKITDSKCEKRDTMVLQIIAAQKDALMENPDGEESQKLLLNFDKYLKNNDFRKAEEILKNLGNDSKLRKKYDETRNQYLEDNFDTHSKVIFGNYFIIRKVTYYGIIDKYGKEVVPFEYDTYTTSEDVVIFINSQGETKYDKKLNKIIK